MRFFTNTLGNLREAYTNRHEPERLHSLANMYWHIVLSITAFVVSVSLGYGLWQLVSVVSASNNENESFLSPNSGTSVLKREALQAIIEDITERRARYDLLKGNPPRLSDPSR